MIYLNKLMVFLKRIFKLFDITELRFLSERKANLYYSERVYEDWEKIKEVANFYKNNEKTLTILLNYLELSYNGTARAFYNLLRQAHVDTISKRKRDEMVRKGIERKTKKK